MLKLEMGERVFWQNSESSTPRPEGAAAQVVQP